MKQKYCYLLLPLLCVVLGAGCASPISVTNMQVKAVQIQNHHPFTVSVQAAGGHETNPLLYPDISNESFAQAISDSIVQNGVFSSVISSGKGDYLLEASIINVDRPAAGFDMTVVMTVNWKLTHVSSRKIVYQSVVEKSFSATVGDAFVGMKRFRLAQEGAARENIQEGLRRLSQLNLRGD